MNFEREAQNVLEDVHEVINQSLVLDEGMDTTCKLQDNLKRMRDVLTSLKENVSEEISAEGAVRQELIRSFSAFSKQQSWGELLQYEDELKNWPIIRRQMEIWLSQAETRIIQKLKQNQNPSAPAGYLRPTKASVQRKK